MEFAPVWVSSVEHLGVFTEIISAASLLDKMVGRYAIPDGYPHLRMNWGLPPWGRAPMVMFANGVLSVDTGSITFQSRPRPMLPRVLGNFDKNLRRDFGFRLAREQVIAVERYEMPKPFIKYYSLPWTRIRSTLDGTLGDLLLAVGGFGPLMSGIRERNAEFMSMLQAALQPPS